MAKRGPAKTVEVDSSHVAYMSHPKGDGQAHRRGCYLRTRQLVAKQVFTLQARCTSRARQERFGAKAFDIENQPIRMDPYGKGE
jgi:hypothetical protein